MSDASEAIATVVLSGRPVAEALNLETTRRWETTKRPEDPVPCLASVAIGEGSPFHLYQRQQKRAVEKLGFNFRGLLLPEGVTQERLVEAVADLNGDPTIHGIIVQHPLPKQLDFFALMSKVAPEKDIDGVGAVNLGRLLARRPLHVPAVALAAQDILRAYHIPTQGEHLVVVGRSETVGLPTALLHLMKGESADATVTVVHSQSRDRDRIIGMGRVVISCAGVPEMLHRGNVARGAAVVDVGLSTVDDPSAPNGVRMSGDAQNLQGWAGALTPVPGGVGPVTVAELLRSTVKGWEISTGKGVPP